MSLELFHSEEEITIDLLPIYYISKNSEECGVHISIALQERRVYGYREYTLHINSKLIGRNFTRGKLITYLEGYFEALKSTRKV